MIRIMMLVTILLLSVGCSNKTKELVVTDKKCELKPKKGKCKARFTRYYFNNSTKQCEQFTWGGCGGVVPFETLSKCKQTCK